nr:immunoglobulin light chain junction region [Mus musculus]
CQNDYSYPFTF